jgi:hypothetical protein
MISALQHCMIYTIHDKTLKTYKLKHYLRCRIDRENKYYLYVFMGTIVLSLKQICIMNAILRLAL